ncbi:MAG: hypothetical protein PWQ37_1068 [Candidatus Petromonas sp.]|jgi:uncharacterized alkaline shock family protein YloU|nr:hypothetical protein [Candidatus Petromonas sp.]
MTAKIENSMGSVYISNDVISTIAGASAIECYGLVGMASKSAADGIVRLLKKENLDKGVKIHIEDNSVIIDLYIIVQFGTKISVVANNIIEKVKYNVENQTGMTVKKVNINIEGVRVQS